MTITTRIHTFFHGRLVGKDGLGNRYFEERRAPRRRRQKRWVLYAGAAEPSQVPPEWHGWLHYTTDNLPEQQHLPHYDWQKPAQANLSGTRQAYLPQGHLQRAGRHAPTMAEYEAWKP